MQVDCYLQRIPADVAIMRSDDPHVDLVREQFVIASSKKSFRDLFGTIGNTRGALFSHGTHNLVSVTADAPTYIGDSLIASLAEYDNFFTISPQTDAVPTPDNRPDQTIVMVTPVCPHPPSSSGATRRVHPCFLGSAFAAGAAGACAWPPCCR